MGNNGNNLTYYGTGIIKMSGKNTFRVCVEEDGVIYKVTSIYLLNDGSFKVDVPYCPYEKGVIIKFPIEYKGIEKIHKDKFVKAALTTKRPQLSIHASGFVQFSGPGITSGIDKITGEIKGLGLQSHPLRNPVWSGPTFAITCWGFKKGFQLADGNRKSDIIYDKGIFKEQLPMEARPYLNTFMIEGWVLPFSDINDESKIFSSEEGEMILATIQRGSEKFAYPMRVIRLKNIPCIIGLLPSFRLTHYGSSHEFGFMLSSPGEKSKTDDGIWYVMQAIYPDFIKEEYPYLDL